MACVIRVFAWRDALTPDGKAAWASGYFTECPDCEARRVRAVRELTNAAAALGVEHGELLDAPDAQAPPT